MKQFEKICQREAASEMVIFIDTAKICANQRKHFFAVGGILLV
jgi:hypothetical protein